MTSFPVKTRVAISNVDDENGGSAIRVRVLPDEENGPIVTIPAGEAREVSLYRGSRLEIIEDDPAEDAIRHRYGQAA